MVALAVGLRPREPPRSSSDAVGRRAALARAASASMLSSPTQSPARNAPRDAGGVDGGAASCRRRRGRSSRRDSGGTGGPRCGRATRAARGRPPLRAPPLLARIFGLFGVQVLHQVDGAPRFGEARAGGVDGEVRRRVDAERDEPIGPGRLARPRSRQAVWRRRGRRRVARRRGASAPSRGRSRGARRAPTSARPPATTSPAAAALAARRPRRRTRRGRCARRRRPQQRSSPSTSVCQPPSR